MATRGFVRTGTLVGLAVALVLLPGAAHACSVCFQSQSGATRVAFIASTAFMTFLPLAVVGGVAFWVRRRFVRAEIEAGIQS